MSVAEMAKKNVGQKINHLSKVEEKHSSVLEH
jgi:hypothetical protein